MSKLKRCTPLLLLLVMTSSIAGQSSTTEENEQVCAAVSGWSYSSSSSSSGGSSSSSSSSSGGSFSFSSSSISGICIQAEVPEECIKANEHCQWCAQEDFSGQRCNMEFLLKEQGCSDVEVMKSSYSSDAANEDNRFNHQVASARIRIGGSVDIPFRVKEPKIYPVDLYYLMDASSSMRDDLVRVRSLATSLVATLEELTSGEEGSVQLGFGKFVDKVQTPMTQLTPYRLQHPYEEDTESPYLFKNVIGLTRDTEKFKMVLRNQTVSGNLDPPEGALDAMLQVVQCKQLIGWRDNALRLLLVATESAYHYAGDGSGYLGGISKANDGKCHTTKKGIYTAAESQDYPSVNQVVRAVEKKSITPIFAIGNSYKELYKHVSENVFRGSTWGVLKSDSSNVVDLVRQAYKDISGKQEMVTSNPDEDVLCPWYTALKPDGEIARMSSQNAIVEGLNSGSKVFYNVSLSASKNACSGKASCHVGDVIVKTRQYDDRLTVDTTVIAAFDCAKTVMANSPSCSGHGSFSCGICTCGPDWSGAICDEPADGLPGCLGVGSSIECSGRGVCNDGSCQCDPGYRHNKAKIYGAQCECDDCYKVAGLICSGNGRAKLGGPNDCTCECECNEGWSGDDCGCANSTLGCLGLGGAICSGYGDCVCGACVCDLTKGFGGPTCSDCTENCPSCLMFQDCVQCIMHGTGPYNQTCEKNCKQDIEVAETNSMNQDDIDPASGTVLCAAIDASDNCKFYYTYQALPTGVVFRAELEKRCKPAYSLLIILWCILLFLLIGLILLCCWRCCVYVIDKEEEKNYRLASAPGLVPLLPAMGASSVIEFIKAKYLVRRSAKVAVISVRRSFFNGNTSVMWRTYAGSAADDEFEVLSVGEAGTTMRKKQQQSEKLVVHGKNGDSTIEVVEFNSAAGGAASGGQAGRVAAAEDGRGGGGANGSGFQGGYSGNGQNTASTMRFETINETSPLLGGYYWGDGEVTFKDGEEFGNIEIPLNHDFDEKETTFWVELHGQEKGVALGLKRTKVVVIKDEEAGIIGFPKPSYVFKENDGLAVVPVHRTVGMDGPVQVSWFTRDITAINGQHYRGGRGVVEFADGEVTQHIEVSLIPDIIYDENEKAFNIMLEEPKGGATLDLSHCMVTMLCDEECSLVQFPKDGYPFMENCGVAEVVVLRTRNTKGVSTVRWYTEDETAIAGKDYEAAQGVLTFSDAATECYIRVTIIDNDVYDASGRAFRIVLADPSDGTKLAQNIATISIIEDDEPGLFEFSKTSLVMRSKVTLGRLSVIRSLGSDGHIIVPWIIRALTGKTLPPEVSAMVGSLDFRNGEISKYLELDLSGVKSSDGMNFVVVLQEPSGGGKIGVKHAANVTVFAEEDFGSVSFAQSRFDVTATTGIVTLLVSRKGDTSSAAFVVCETSDQSAISGTHYRGGTISVVFDSEETVKEVGIPVYNDPNYKGQLYFGVCLKSSPGGPKVSTPSEAVVAITCVPTAPVIHAGLAPPEHCTVEFVKPKYLLRRSAKMTCIPLHRSSTDGALLVQWRAIGPPISSDKGQSSNRWSSSSSSSSSDEEEEQGWGSGVVVFEDGEGASSIELSLKSRNILASQVNLQVELVKVSKDDGSDHDVVFGLKETDVVILNDIDAGTVGFSKATFSFKEGEDVVAIPVHRLGGMDGSVSARWRTVDGSALHGRDYDGGQGVVSFANNQITENIRIKLKDGYSTEEDKKFVVELDKFKGGAKSGLRRTTVFIIGDEDRSVVQFSKPSYPIIGTSVSARLVVLRTGSFQRRVALLWRTEDGTAKAGIDYRASQNLLVFEPGETKSFIDVPLSGKATEAKVFTVLLQTSNDPADIVSSDGSTGKVFLGSNSSATVSIIASLEPGIFEFSKPSFVFKASSDVGTVPVIRSGGTDGEISIPWKIESLDKPSPFAGAEGYLLFRDGQITSNIEIELEGVPTDAFVVVLLPTSDGNFVLGSATRASITIIGEVEETVVEMECTEVTLKDVEIVEVRVIRGGNLEEATYVGWKTNDGSATNGRNFIGGAGNLVFDPQQPERKILIPVLAPPTDSPATFSVHLTDVRGAGRIGDAAGTEVTLEPVPRDIVPIHHGGYQQSAPAEIVVEFLRKRYLFRQSQGSSLIPVRRSHDNGMLVLHWRTQPLSQSEGLDDNDIIATQRRTRSSSPSSDSENMSAIASEGAIEWGSGTLAFEDGELEANIEIVLCRQMAHRETNFRIELIDSYDRVRFAVPTTMVTVIRDKDPGLLGFASPRYDFTCSDSQLVIPVNRSSGSDGTVAVPWFTRDSSAVGGVHYLPGEGNLVFGDGETSKQITLPMPKRVQYFDEDEVSFFLTLGDPTGGASLSVYEASVVLRNDIVPAQISFSEPRVQCAQSRGTVDIPVRRSQDTNGHVTLTWQVRGVPGKAKSRYEGRNGTIVFGDGESEMAIQMKLPPQVQPSGTDAFIVTLEQPSSGRATLGEHPACNVFINNDITPGVFSLEKSSYSFKQSQGRDKVRIVRKGGCKGQVALPWRILPSSDDAPPSPMHDLYGSVEFEDRQTHSDVTIIFPPDTDEDVENLLFMLMPPEDRAELEEPYRASVLLINDLKCEIGFTKPSYDVRGDIDTLLVPVVRDGPKGRPAAVDYKTIEGTAMDCTHYIGGEGTLVFEAGENKKDILVPIMNDLSGGRVSFNIELCDVAGSVEIGANDIATVSIDNVAGHGLVEMASKELTTRQTSGLVTIVVIRKMGKKGAVHVPWFVERVPSTPSSTAGPGVIQADNYDKLEGALTFQDGEDKKELEIPLSRKPQDNDVTAIDVTLLTPTSGGGALLGDVTTTRVLINNDLSGGTINFADDRYTCFGTDGEVRIPVVRTGECSHPCQVTWEAHDDSAVRGKHYRAGKGSLAFVPNEERKDIVIPIVNDPSGDVMYFNVTLGHPRGGVKLGPTCKTQIMIDHVQEMRREFQIQLDSSAQPHVHGRVGFADPAMQAKQSEGKIIILVERKNGNKGRVVVPWSIESSSLKSPYHELHGVEEFKDGEDESHIEIETPQLPQDKDQEEFRVMLGEPTGGAILSDDVNCLVSVVNDLIPGRVSFPEEEIKVNQSDEKINIPVERTIRTAGKVRVPWRTTSATPRSPYNNISGIETFEDGEQISHIRIRIPQEPQESKINQFQVVLSNPKSPEAILGDTASCNVTVNNDKAPGLITFDQNNVRTLQSKERVRLKVMRHQQRDGRVIVPWKVVPESPDSVYIGVVGEMVLEDGEDHGSLDIPLPQIPLSNVGENVTVILEPPVGALAVLADDAMCNVAVTHDIGEGLVELRSRDQTCNSDDGYASVTVVRKIGHDFSADVLWSTEDGDAMSGQHYEAGEGKLKFKPGEMERNIRIPLVNDPTGETRHFYVKLRDVKGRDKLGDVTTCKVRISSEAMPPNVVCDFDADLGSPQSIKATWLPPLDGAPVDGYRVTYWSRPGTVKTTTVGGEATTAELGNLLPGTPYQINVRPFNHVGDGPSSDTMVVDTQPDLRLSYHTPIQARTSEGVASFALKRNIKDFTDVVTWQLVKETRKKKTRGSTSSTSSSSSPPSSDQSSDQSPLVVSSGVLEFPPGTDQMTVQYPLKQNMRRSNQVYRFVAKQPSPSDESDTKPVHERHLANIELKVINDTGYPGRVRRPLATSSSPFEAIVSWEAPPPGPPINGYKVIARGGDEPDVVADVGPHDRKTTLKGLRPSTNYDITVQPYNDVGEARPSPPAHITTQEELKIEFTERFYTFKSSDKVAVIPIRRHFTRGYATLNWNARWSKHGNDVTDTYSSSSDSEQEEATQRRSWASGSVAFPDGVDTAEVRIPLQQATPPIPKKKSFFWLHVVDPSKHKNLAAMRIKLVDDRERGIVGFVRPLVTLPGGDDAADVALLPLVRHNGTEDHVTIDWRLEKPEKVNDLVLTDSHAGSVTFCNGENESSVAVFFESNWVDLFHSDQPLDVNVELTEAHRGAEISTERTCIIRLIPADRGVVTVSRSGPRVSWPLERNQLEFQVNRSGDCYGPVYLQWDLVADAGCKDDLVRYFPNLAGDLHMASREKETVLTVPSFDDEQIPYLEGDVPISLRVAMVTHGVGLSEESELLPITLVANRGVLSVHPRIRKLVWPVQDGGIEFSATREGGADGPAYLQWEIVKFPQGIAEIGTIPPTYHDTLTRCIRETHGDIRFAHGETTSKFYIPTCVGSEPGPVEDTTFPVRILPISSGVRIKDGNEIALFVLKKRNSGIIRFPVERFEMESVDKESISIPILRQHGSDGNVSVEYSIQEDSARSGVHYVRENTSGIVYFKHGEAEKYITVLLISDAQYRHPVKFFIELGCITGGATTKMGDNLAEVTLFGNYVEPQGAITFNNEDEDAKEPFNAIKNSFVSVPIKRIGGTGGKLQVLCSTESGTALEGIHYKSLQEVLTFGDGETMREVRIEILPEKYQSSLHFHVKLTGPDSAAGDCVTTTKTINLAPTHQEPTGVFVTPADEDCRDMKVDAKHQSSLVIPIKRCGGSEGIISMKVKTKDGSAKAGKHYKLISETLTLHDGETVGDAEIPILPSSYRERLHFFVEFDVLDDGLAKSDKRAMKIYLLPTHKEPPGFISIDERSDQEVNSVSCNVVNVILRRHNGTGGAMTVRLKTKDVSALHGLNYQELNEVVSFEDGEENINIPISIFPQLHRNHLHFQVEISDPTGGCQLGDVTSTNVTLLPTDIEPSGYVSLLLSDEQNYIKANAAFDKMVCIPVTRPGGVGGEIEVNYKAEQGTAKDGKHFVPTEGILTLQDHEDKAEICIPLLEESYREELDFVLRLSGRNVNPSASNTIKIILLPTDNEPPGRVSLPEGEFEVSAKTCDCLYIPIRRHDGVGGDVSVKIKSLDGSAIEGIHYKGIEGIVTLKDRQDNVEVPIEIRSEQHKDNLNFTVEISEPQGGAKIGQNYLDIKLLSTELEPRGHLIVPDGNDLCFNSKKVASATIPLRRVNGNRGVLSADYCTVECADLSTSHYIATRGTLVLGDGQEESVVEVPLLQNEHVNDVKFKLVIKPLATSEEPGDDEIEVNITLEATRSPIEKGMTLPNNSVTAISTDESFAIIPVHRSSDSLISKVIVPFKTKSGTAKPDVHYVPVEDKVEILEGEKEAHVQIPLMKASHKNPVAFLVEFDDDCKSSAFVTLLPTITNPPGRVEFSNSNFTFTLPKKLTQDGIISIPVRRRKGTGGRVEVDYFTRDNSAISGKHYQEVNGQLVFEEGENHKMIDIQLLPGSSFAEDVNFVLELGAITGGAEVAEIYETEITLEPPLDENDPGVLGFASTKIYFTSYKLKRKRDTNVKVEIPVRRTQGCGGDVAADFLLRDNMAVSGKHYVDTEGEVRFMDKEALKTIEIDLLPGSHFTEPVSFTAELGETYGGAELGIYETEVLLTPKEHHSKRDIDHSLSSDSSTSFSSEDSSSVSSSESDSDISIEIEEVITIKVVGDGSAGQIGFMRERYDVTRGVDAEAVITITRSGGFKGSVDVLWSARENTAEVDKDFVESYGVACFQDEQEEVCLKIPLLDERPHEEDQQERNFIVELGQPEGGATLGRYESSVFILPHRQVSLQRARLVAPRNARTVVNDATCFSVAWDPQEAPVHEYLVSYKRAGSHGDPKRHTVPSSDHSLTIEGLVPESAYAVVVSALGDDGQQLSSDVIACNLPGQIPGPPNRLAFQVLSPTSLNCSWGEPAVTNGLITGYEVLYKPTDEHAAKMQPPVVVRIPDGHFRSLLVENLRENTAYAYTVRAQNKSGLGAPREATMKIEHVGSRPPSAIFLDEENMKIVQKQIELEEAQRQERMKNRSTSSTSVESDPGSSTRVTSRTQLTPSQDTSSAATKTLVTRYIHRDGKSEPEVETVEYDGRLTQEELNKKNVQVISYDTTQSSMGSSPSTVTIGYRHAPDEYSNTDVQTNVSQDTQVFTDVQESEDGDTEITTITKTYRTTTTERRMETTSGMSSMMVPLNDSNQNTKH